MCVCLYQKSVCKEYRTRLQCSVTGFLMPDQRHFLSLYSYSLVIPREKPLLAIPKSIYHSVREIELSSIDHLDIFIYLNILEQ